MKKLIEFIMAFTIALLVLGCKAREKQVQKSENQSETKSEATARIEEETFEIIFDKSILKNDFSYKNSTEETSKNEKKNVDKGKEYYENGNLKKEWERDMSEYSEIVRKNLIELEERIIKEQEVSRYWENSSKNFSKLLEQEKNKTKDYSMQLKAKETFAWQMFFVGFFIGAIAIRPLLRWLKSLVVKSQPWLKLISYLKKV